ncbi:uncharacterized protein [Spinacia oleracea]|uniref:Uncharacterized protein n=1 Tax=Spinacia oleracea TaxID=3562 RepID=A0ABM3RKK1_SPIOL|nr:uncharacterized protein LOC130470296 [Spinacia oleracea]
MYCRFKMTGVRNQYERRSKHKHDKQGTNPVDTEERNKNERAKETEPVVPQSLLNDIMNNLEDPEHHTNQETEVNTNEKSNDNGNQEQESDLTQGRKEIVRDPEDHTNQETEVNTNEKAMIMETKNKSLISLKDGKRLSGKPKLKPMQKLNLSSMKKPMPM